MYFQSTGYHGADDSRHILEATTRSHLHMEKCFMSRSGGSWLERWAPGHMVL